MKERLAICNEEDTGGRARVTTEWGTGSTRRLNGDKFV